jgi:nitrogen fixation/metabolism regulation signal transduction histidine kinase
MVFAVVITLLITGIITFYNISQQYREQQEELVLDKLTKISAGINKQLINNGIIAPDEQAEVAFNAFADMNGVDLNLFDLNGRLILSTQPKIFENELVAPKMNALSYLYLSRLQKSEYINTERIGQLSFIVAYVPLKNSKNDEIAYLGLPYFSNEKDFQDRIGIFLNALINVYAIVFVAIGFFAVFVANRITSPLTIVQKSLSETKIGRKNEPILWKGNDEIGNLVSEYNTMIAALEESAQKLARSERETAWREMAKQVAHEIKNPLTPLKLGVQLLERSWKEKDPKFNEKFEKFTKSFIEQIESLAHIASEFSNFAKMPETVLENVNIQDIIEQSIVLYRQSDHTTIILEDNSAIEVIIKADKDQLLRCFNNLIKNAIEARFEKRKSFIRILLFCLDNQLHIEIKDNGTGIPEELGQKIFTPNFTTKSSGTGLGLAFVKQTIESIDGTISFETVPGIGTTFFITIPFDNKQV